MLVTKKTWIISDTHFFHKRVCEFSNRPENHQQQIIKNWKNLVQPEDIIYHLGDVIFGNKKQLCDILKDLPGIKILIRGNHDKGHSDTFFFDAGFKMIYNLVIIDNIVLTHRPSVLYEKNQINIHGHFHNMPKKNWEPNLVDILTDRHYLYSVEIAKYRPLCLKNILNQKVLLKTIDVK